MSFASDIHFLSGFEFLDSPFFSTSRLLHSLTSKALSTFPPNKLNAMNVVLGTTRVGSLVRRVRTHHPLSKRRKTCRSADLNLNLNLNLNNEDVCCVASKRLNRRRGRRDRRSGRTNATDSSSSSSEISAADGNGTSSKQEKSARTNMGKMGALLQKCGWFGFWGQFSLITVSAVMTVFSVIFTKPSSVAAKFSLYLVLVGVAAGFFSTYWTFGYVQLSKKIRRSMKNLANAPKKSGVDRNLSIGITGNIVGLGTTLLGMQAVVGFLVAKTLANATANPFLSGGAGSWNPVLALDVFLVQAATNCLLSHFMSMCMNMWLQKKLKAV